MSKKFEHQIYDSLFYPGDEPRVPINKLNLKNWNDLNAAEAEILTIKSSHNWPKASKELSFKGMKTIHKHLFKEIYEWAGQPRTYTTGRGETPFAAPEYIDSYVNGFMEKLKSENFLKGTSVDEFSERAAFYINEINAAHPFIEGNGRVQRQFLKNLAEQAGHKFSLSKAEITKEEWYSASKIGFEQVNHQPMAKLIKKAITPVLIETITSKFLILSEEVQQLSPNDINRIVSDKREVQDQKEVIENLSLLVYGRKNVLDNELENINQNKNHANVIANQIKTDPEQIAPLAGEKKMIMGKDHTRKTAELNAPRLSQAIDDYRNIRQRAETTLIREHNSERERKSLSVAYPSNEVMQVLNLPVEKQKEALQKSPELQNRIQTLSTKISERLSPSENKAILKGDNESLAKSLNVSSAQAKTIANTVQQTRSAERQIQAIKVQARQQGIDRSR